MHEYHGRHLENYILTLFSTVASIYRHPSLRAAINIVVVRILILQHEYGSPRITNNAQESLQNFCRWQTAFNERADDSPNHHDVAVLLTRNDICRGPGKCDTLGLAELGTMCDWEKSCAIIEDNGLSAAFTIAHELAHLFNMPHDDERKCGEWMPLTKANFHIMAPTLEYNTHPWSWSACSAAMLERFLERRSGTECLFDEPIERRFYDEMFEMDPPGSKYDVNQQCKFVFGPHAELCPYMPSCRRLWCSLHVGVQIGCRTQHMPWADGTPCDKSGNMFCHRGQCVGMTASRRRKIDGGWGEWGEWGECSRTCGGGVQKASRHCDSPKPSNGGKYCVGIREQYRSCNVGECPWDTPGFREVQCSEFNNKDVGIHGVPATVQWVPKFEVAANERCKLYCRVSGVSAFYLLKNKVTDGTPCDQNGNDLCVDGTCRSAGCDHVLDSGMKRDRCGICGGDGSGCRVVKGQYNERGSFGYNEVMKIPAGSANIDIRQHGWAGAKDDDNYLSLRSASGEYLLNGHYQVSVFRLQIPVQDVVLEYSGSDNVVERINGTGPLRSDIYVHVLSVGNLNPPDIQYEFMTTLPTTTILRTPNSAHSSAPARHPTTGHAFWRLADQWTACNRQCKGEQQHSYVCIDGSTNRQTNERNCLLIRPSPPPQRRPCNTGCTVKWQIDDVSECSVKCGSGEKRVRVTCVRVEDADLRRSVPMNDRECESLGGRPSERMACFVDCTGKGGHWTYSQWTECSASCGESGMSRRSAYCTDQSGRSLDSLQCDLRSKDITEKPCNRMSCPRWSYGPWSECSKSCDGGLRRRQATCVDAEDRELPFNRCNIMSRLDYEKCNEEECVWWEFGEWGVCNGECGKGTAQRTATCRSRRGLLDDARCDIRERITSKECDTGRACANWKTTEWTACSNRCGEQWSTRRVECTDSDGRSLKEEECVRRVGPRPDTHRECAPGPCPFWRTSQFGPCSVSCGRGIRSREIACVVRDEIVDDSFCTAPRPDIVEQCTVVECAEWVPSSWSTCSVTCGSGNQTRTLTCLQNGNTVHETMCDLKAKPKKWKQCSRDSCPLRPSIDSQKEPPQIWWATGSWTECSAQCGKGTQRRLVKCRDKFRDLPENYCGHLEKVEAEKSCELKPCVKWVEGSWKACPSTCGELVYQEREIRCVTVEGARDVTQAFCDPTNKPNTTRDCHLPKCPQAEPPMGVWITRPWAQCSVSCGGGWRTRSIDCSTQLCDVTKKPKDSEPCGEENCLTNIPFTWQIPPWTQCSVTCGEGEQRREVWCEEDSTRIKVPDSRCPLPKPLEKKKCNQSACSSNQTTSNRVTLEETLKEKGRWQTGTWSACSTTCGKGSRRRSISCLSSITNQTITESRCDLKSKPIFTIRCRLRHCPRWKALQWEQCSATCGEGIQTRKILCQIGRKRNVDEKQCSDLRRPANSTKCQVAACPVYTWTTTPWSKCIDPCGQGEQTRMVHCMKDGEVRAASRMCAIIPRPVESRKCSSQLCPYEWVPAPWNTCSKTCGNGTQSRSVECRLKSTHAYSSSSNKPKLEPVVPREKCGRLHQPVAFQDCNLNACDAEFTWVAEPWGSCSTTCGAGVRRRKVRCVGRGGARVARSFCESLTARPNRTQPCFTRNCLPSTCQEIRSQMTTTHAIDAEYTVLLDGYPIRVHCHRMNETIPRAYLNVDPETNFAEIYGRRLIFPHTCPYNGERNDSCECSSEGAAGAGFTRFKRVRLDLLNRRININDFTFAQTEHGLPVPFATAGDCYSMRDCPQGRFSVNLRGSGLRIAEDLQWEDRGHRTSSRIDRTYNNARIEGQCGGYCGKCAPDKFKGLVFEVDPQQKPYS
ncbi:unnamed protein product, partial [Mesorhabditis belari]|uniref:A disintegrin and metalloproteinase with thrombospondin motifs 9 n=1 Tax=Mesorhabditis belari TaxID=2138241 RepID=A0AAF3J9Y9_9BILA